MSKQVVWVVSVMMVMSTISIVKADYPVEDICVGVAGNQIRPDIDGDIVIWEDGLDICWTRWSDPNRIQHSIVVGGTQDYPAVGGQSIVWRDKNSDYDIGIYDVESGADWMLSSNDGATQRYPKASDAYIICEDNSGGFYNVAVYDEVTDAFVRIAPSGAMQTNLDINGSRVVWRDDRDGKQQIYLCDLSVTPYQAAVVDPTGSSQWNPAVSGDLIIWEDHTDSSDVNLVGWSISAGAVVWRCDDAGAQAAPDISGELLVWQDSPAGTVSASDIRGYDFGTGAWLAIAANAENDTFPAVSGRTVVWQRNNTDIVGTVIPGISILSVTEPVGDKQVLAGTEMVIAWAMTEGTLPAEVKIEFSSDDGQSWQVVEPTIPADTDYRWTTPADVDSQQCRIQVSGVDDPSVKGISEPFTVFQCDAALTADLTGDCFVGLDDFAAMASQWLTCGNPYDENGCFQ